MPMKSWKKHLDGGPKLVGTPKSGSTPDLGRKKKCQHCQALVGDADEEAGRHRWSRAEGMCQTWLPHRVVVASMPRRGKAVRARAVAVGRQVRRSASARMKGDSHMQALQ